MLPMDILDVRPTSISLEVSTKCPLNCVYCERKGKGDNMEKQRYMDIMKRVEETEHIKNAVYCGIGESFMNPAFYEMVKESPFKGISIISSGMLPIKFDELKETGKLKLAIFSIDAVTEETIKNTCGENYRFDVLVENLKKLREVTKDDKSIMSLLNCTINENNYNTLPQIVEFAKEHQFKIVHFSLPWGMEEFIVEHMAEIELGIIKAKSIASKAHILCDNPFRSYCCIQYDSILPFVNLEGNVFPCGFALHQNYQVGNILNDSFEDIWNGEKYSSFRQGGLCEKCFMMRMDKLRKGDVNAGE